MAHRKMGEARFFLEQLHKEAAGNRSERPKTFGYRRNGARADFGGYAEHIRFVNDSDPLSPGQGLFGGTGKWSQEKINLLELTVPNQFPSFCDNERRVFGSS